jgi:TrmH family RNA methyltransferase
VQRLRRLLARRDARDAEGVFVIEGPTLLAEALKLPGRVTEIYGHAPDAPQPLLNALAPGVLQRIATTVSPQPVLAVVTQQRARLEDLSGPGPIVVCVDVRDPGNLGTILRSAEASGACGIVCCDGTVDVYNPKCVRGSAGAVLRVPVVAGGDPVTVLRAVAADGRRRVATGAGIGERYDACDLSGPIALILGNETHGLPDALALEVDVTVHIPMDGAVESLNVGIASAVLCFEAARQRRVRG